MVAKKTRGSKTSQIEIATKKYKRLHNDWLDTYRSGDKWRRQYRTGEVMMYDAKRQLDTINKRLSIAAKKRKYYENELIRRGLWNDVKKKL